MSADARAEAERRWPTDHREPNGVSRAMNDARQQGWDARGEWQASRPFTEEDVEAAYRAYREAQEGRPLTDSEHAATASGIEKSWMRAALDAVHACNTARHTEGD